MLVGIPRDICLWEGSSDFLDFLPNRQSICVLEVREEGAKWRTHSTKPYSPAYRHDDGAIITTASKRSHGPQDIVK